MLRFLRTAVASLFGWDLNGFRLDHDDMTQSVLIMLIVGFTIYTIAKAIHTLRVARQVTVTFADSYKIFEEEFSFLKKDKEMMRCIELNQLEAKG